MRKTQSRESLIFERLSGYRSEATMNNHSKFSFFRRIILFALLVLVFSLSVFAQYSHTNSEESRPRFVEPEKKTITVSSKAGISTFELEKQAFDLLNLQRAAKSLPPLEWSNDVARVARMHSENMAKYRFFSHTGLDGTMVNDRADLCGLSRWKAIGENIAYNRGYEKPVEFAIERWMQSTSHRGNILNERWKESAVGVAVANDGAVYFTQVFLVRK